MAENFYKGQIFIDIYPTEAAAWCNNSNGKFYIAEIEPENGHRRFEIVEDIKNLDELKAAKIAELKAAWEREENGYFYYDGVRFNADAKARERISFIKDALTESGEDGVDFVDYDNNVHFYTLEDIKRLAAMLGDHIINCHADYNELKARVNAAQTVEQVKAIVWSGDDDE